MTHLGKIQSILRITVTTLHTLTFKYKELHRCVHGEEQVCTEVQKRSLDVSSKCLPNSHPNAVASYLVCYIQLRPKSLQVKKFCYKRKTHS